MILDFKKQIKNSPLFPNHKITLKKPLRPPDKWNLYHFQLTTNDNQISIDGRQFFSFLKNF